MVKRLKNIWFWIDILLIILCAFFYLLANPILWKSGVARTPNLGCTLLSLLCLTVKLPIDKYKHGILVRFHFRDPVWSWNWELAVIVIGTYLFLAFYPG